MNLCESLYTFKIASTHYVNVTHINNPHSFYVRAANIKDEIIALLEDPGKPLTTQEVQLGKVVIYRSNTLKHLARGAIRFVSDENTNKECDIFALDYGCFDKSVNINDIHTANKTDLQTNVPPLAVHCELDLCESIGEEFTKDAIDTMKYFVGAHRAQIIVQGKNCDKLKVVLKTVDCPGDVATMMALLHVTSMVRCDNTVNRFCNSVSSNVQLSTVMKYKYKELKVDDTLRVRVQSGKSLSKFYVSAVNDFKKYIKDQNDFTLYCKSRPVLDTWAPGMCCGVNVSNVVAYERAVIKEITEPGNKALVHLIDWGKETEVNFTNIKSVTSEKYFLEPAIAMLCSTETNQIWKTGLPVFLYPGYEFVIQVTEIGDGLNVPHKVNLYKTKM